MPQQREYELSNLIYLIEKWEKPVGSDELMDMIKQACAEKELILDSSEQNS